ncbi:glycosyltransferase family 9 protein [uncultured Actinobacillus sp.]|uniref:glycosyltransferase family 9 protein n=1 Tax=uncultured Actinobacillus sp. TaxID=417616 RepID=UPI0025CC4511|nr:glycosyltransferase family 9 protein [uncultured Actinobacillus sp.]
MKIEIAKPLLEKLDKLVKIDRSLSFDSQNPLIYRRRALLLQELGCDALAKVDNRISAFLEGKTDQEYYNHQYQSYLDEKRFAEQYQAEKDSHYYEIFSYILNNEKYLTAEEIDPILFVLRSGNLQNLGLFNLALRDCNFALNSLQDFPEEYALACFNKAILLNLVGEFKEGWKFYEYRWKTGYKSFKKPIEFPRPRWQGEDISQGKGRLLIHSEQGIGDNIQFVRYAIYLKQLGFDVLVWNNTYVDDFLTFNLAKYHIPTAKLGDKVEFSHWIPMMSLPYILGTELTNIPLTEKYLVAAPEYLQKWQKKLPLKNNELKIGVVWQGGIKTETDKIRSIPVALFAQLFNVQADFYVLQKEISEADQAVLAHYENVVDCHWAIESFHDTAAMIEHLDLVISVDTSVAHLAAAMGKPTWILINYKPDFRWLISREDSVWYESVRLFRQTLDYDWQPVIESVIAELNAMMRAFGGNNATF